HPPCASSFFQPSGHHRDLHSFPTRRSSDLESNKWRYNGPNDQYWDYPVVQGNQQAMHFAYLFNWLDKPWATQKWSRSIGERYYRSEEHTSELQSRENLVCRLLLEKKKPIKI